jgi:hypothetical protein
LCELHVVLVLCCCGVVIEARREMINLKKILCES